MDTTRINHNNSGHKYRIAVDIAKEGSHIWDLTPYFKGRVGDNNFGLQVTWYYQGQLMNVVGMKPYIEGLVGQYSFGKNGEIDMDPNAVPVRYDGSPDDCEEAGNATFYFPSQMFPKEGIFKGFIGVKDDRDGSKNPQISGVTIWFKVLPGIAQMGHACDAYVDELDKALQNFKDKLDQHDKDYQSRLQKVIDDARNTYNTQVKNSQDALIALNSEISENRQFQHNLNDQLKGTQDQIRINDVVRRQEFEDLSGKINEQLAHMNFQPDYYLNYQDMTAKNPQGTHNACVTTDNYHVYLYDFDSKTWKDGGQVTSYGIPPQYADAIETSNPDNLVYDPDFKVSGSWTNAGNGKPLVVDTYKHSGMNGSNIMSLSEIDKGASLTSHDIETKGIKQISYGAWINLTHASKPGALSIWGRDSEGVDYKISSIGIDNSSDDDLHFVYSEYCFIPANIVSFRISFELNDKGTMLVCRPQINSGDKLLPYSLQKEDERVDKLEKRPVGLRTDNLIHDPDFETAEDWKPAQDNMSFVLEKDPKFNNSNVLSISNNADTAGAITSNPIYVTSNNDTISIGFWAKMSGNPNPAIEIWWNDYDTPYSPDLNYIADGNWHFYDVRPYAGILVGSDITHFHLDFVLNNQGTMKIARPQINWGSYLLPYSSAEIEDEINQFYYEKDNAIQDPEFRKGMKFWHDQSNGSPFNPTFINDDSTGDAKIIKFTDSDNKGGAVVSYDIPVNNHKIFSFDALAAVTGTEENAYIGVWNENALLDTVVIPNTDNTELKRYVSEGIAIPDGTKNIRFSFALSKGGTFLGAKPRITWGSKFDDGVNKNEYGLPQLDLQSKDTIGDDWTKSFFEFRDGNRVIQGYLQISIQGDSSRAFPKKNYKIKCFSDADYKDKLKWRPKADWDSNNKFNLKANWIDATQSRNLVNAKIFSEATAITPFENEEVAKKLSNTQAFGQMEGFPIELYQGGNYVGLYTLNTKKDDKPFGINSDNPEEEALVFETVGSQLRTKTAKIDGTDYSTVVQDKPTDELIQNFNAFLTFINGSTDDDIRTNLHNYIDVESVINTYLWGVLAQVWDTSAKSNLLLTYNAGKYFYMIPYDMDSTWGLKPDGLIYPVPLPEYDFDKIGDSHMQFVSEYKQMRVFEIVYNLFKPEVKKQYQYLRKNVWSNWNIMSEFKKFIRAIPQNAYERDQEQWPDIPSKGATDYSQIQSAIIKRGNAMDKFIDALMPETDPIENLQNQINQLKNNRTTK